MLGCGLASLIFFSFFLKGISKHFLEPCMQDFFKMSYSSCKNDEYPPPKHCKGGSSSKVGCFKAAHVKIRYEELFCDFLDVYMHVIPFIVCVK